MLVVSDASELVLRWLVPLRFLAVAGQVLALLLARQALGLPLPYATLGWVPALTLASNLALFAPRLRRAIPARALVPALLLFDSLLFTYLLRWSGGPDNPFSALYAIHVAMAAMTGSAAATWAVALTSALGYALVFRWHAPALLARTRAPGFDVGLHAVGMWVAVAVVAVVITYFIGRVTRTLREREVEMRRLGEVAARRGMEVREARSAADAVQVAQSFLPERAVLDLRMEDRSGLELLANLRRDHPGLVCVVLTGYGSIATALEAVRRGATGYLTKPADADEILRAFEPRPAEDGPGEGGADVPSLQRVEWEHIQRVLTACGGNVSRSARLLGLHRRTLQRKLATRPPSR